MKDILDKMDRWMRIGWLKIVSLNDVRKWEVTSRILTGNEFLVTLWRGTESWWEQGAIRHSVLTNTSVSVLCCVSKTCQLWWSLSLRRVDKSCSVLLQSIRTLWKLCSCLILHDSSCYLALSSRLGTMEPFDDFRCFHQCVQCIACHCPDRHLSTVPYFSTSAACWFYSSFNLCLETVINCRVLRPFCSYKILIKTFLPCWMEPLFRNRSNI